MMSVRYPQKAMILAAGFGTRLRPLTNLIPKPLLPLNGKPLLEHHLNTLHGWGVREVLINCHHRADAIFDFVRNYRHPDLCLDLSFEPQILGTGGALRRASWFFEHDPVWLVNGDIMFDVYPDLLLQKFHHKTLAVLWCHETSGPRTVRVEQGNVVDFRSKEPGTSGTYTFCGLHLLSPRILKYIPASGYADIITAYELAMQDGLQIQSVSSQNCYWSDVGTPERYLRTQLDFDSRLVIPAELSQHEAAALTALGWDLSKLRILPLAPRGSARNFIRLRQAERSVILVRYSRERPENELFVEHARFLSSIGISVPKIIFDAPEQRFFMMEDLGDYSLLQASQRRSLATLKRLYSNVLEQLVVFHEKGYRMARKNRLKLMPRFSRKLYEWEHELFAQFYLQKQLKLSQGHTENVLRSLSGITERLLRAKPVLLHRDLQSSNIMLRGGKLYFIDFQSMRFGPPAYDLASLLCDPYVMLPEDMQIELLDLYADISGHGAQNRELFWLAAVQRMVQALGAFCRLAQSPETRRFHQYIPAGREMLQRAARKCGKVSESLCEQL